MWSENLDNKIRAAAGESTHEPGSNAWDKMEALLDQHLPREKKRRGFLFFLLLALLVAVPGFFLVKKYTAGRHNSAAALQTTAPGPSAAPKVPAESPSAPALSLPAEKRRTGQPAVTNSNSSQLSAPAGQGATKRSTGYNRSGTAIPAGHQRSSGNSSHTDPVQSADHKNKQTPPPFAPTRMPEQPITAMTSSPGQEHPKSLVPTYPADTLLPAATPAADTALGVSKPGATDNTQQKSPSSSLRRISFILSAGPDLSSAGSNTGEWRAQYGIGISFRLSDRLSIRTGFYAARKIYSADSAQYHADLGTPLYYKLNKIDADCSVYEIPLLLTYHFKTARRHHWFAAAGASSLIMKKEEYTVQYEMPSGQTYRHLYSFANKNRHLFSTLHLSGGYQYQLSNRLGLMAEPYIKLPVTGVGYGKVKLSSAGILFSLRYSPF